MGESLESIAISYRERYGQDSQSYDRLKELAQTRVTFYDASEGTATRKRATSVLSLMGPALEHIANPLLGPAAGVPTEGTRLTAERYLRFQQMSDRLASDISKLRNLQPGHRADS